MWARNLAQISFNNREGKMLDLGTWIICYCLMLAVFFDTVSTLSSTFCDAESDVDDVVSAILYFVAIGTATVFVIIYAEEHEILSPKWINLSIIVPSIVAFIVTNVTISRFYKKKK